MTSGPGVRARVFCGLSGQATRPTVKGIHSGWEVVPCRTSNQPAEDSSDDG